jgi:hypothetical protein
VFRQIVAGAINAVAKGFSEAYRSIVLGTLRSKHEHHDFLSIRGAGLVCASRGTRGGGGMEIVFRLVCPALCAAFTRFPIGQAERRALPLRAKPCPTTRRVCSEEAASSWMKRARSSTSRRTLRGKKWTR